MKWSSQRLKWWLAMRRLCRALSPASSEYTAVIKVMLMFMGSTATYFLRGVGIVLRRGLSWRWVKLINDLPRHNWEASGWTDAWIAILQLLAYKEYISNERTKLVCGYCRNPVSGIAYLYRFVIVPILWVALRLRFLLYKAKIYQIIITHVVKCYVLKENANYLTNNKVLG